MLEFILLFGIKNGLNSQNSYSKGNRSRKGGPLLLANLAIIPKSELVFYMNINWICWGGAAGEVETAAYPNAKFLWLGECANINPKDVGWINSLCGKCLVLPQANSNSSHFLSRHMENVIIMRSSHLWILYSYCLQVKPPCWN